VASSRVTEQTHAFAYSNGVSGFDFASFALRTVEMVHRDDVENVIKLIYETI
jgi:hypothetical protein